MGSTVLPFDYSSSAHVHLRQGHVGTLLQKESALLVWLPENHASNPEKQYVVASYKQWSSVKNVGGQ